MMRATADPETHERLPAEGTDEVEVLITGRELSGLIGCINEALQAVDDWEFDTRVGLSPTEARGLLEDIDAILRSTFFPQ